MVPPAPVPAKTTGPATGATRESPAPNPEFRLAEIEVTSYRQSMTTPTEVRIAGVAWPAYKLIALAAGLLVLFAVGIATTSAAAAVLAGSAVGAVVWVALSLIGSAGA